MTDLGAPSRTERRKQQTRRSLLEAAQQLLAEGRTAVSVLDITTLADVGNGSFYNHFATKDELFDAAVMDVVDQLPQEAAERLMDLAAGKPVPLPPPPPAHTPALDPLQ